jgi:hypothetical protein
VVDTFTHFFFVVVLLLPILFLLPVCLLLNLVESSRLEGIILFLQSEKE